MCPEAESEEQLGEIAPAGVPAIEVDKKGMPERWAETNRETQEWLQELSGVSEESSFETPPSNSGGGEPAVGGTIVSADTEEVG